MKLGIPNMLQMPKFCDFSFTDLSLQDFLLHEYNNVCNVRSVRIGHSGRHGRYAVIYLATMTDVDKALNEPRLITKTYHNAEVDVMLAGEEIVEDKWVIIYYIY